MEKKALIVEDESLVALEIESVLRHYGIESCKVADSVEEALEVLDRCIPDLVLLDIYLAGEMTGIDGCKIFKERGIPVIFLTAYSDDTTINQALECEPDTYLVKPFRRAELYAAVEKVFKKKAREALIEVCDSVSYDRKRGVVLKNEEEIFLTKKELLLLELLVRNRGKIVPFETIDFEIWPEMVISESTRRSLIHRLRQKCCKDAIRTMSGIGVVLE